MSSHYPMYSLSRALSIEEKKLYKVIGRMNEGVADKYFVFENGQIEYRFEKKDALGDFLEEEYSKLDKSPKIASLASFRSEISSETGWDRRKPLENGREFYCAPFQLKFEMSQFASQSMIHALKWNQFEEVSETLGFKKYEKKLKSVEEIFSTIGQFVEEFIRGKKSTFEIIGKHKHKLEYDDYFMERVMYFQQSLDRYGLRPE